MSLLRYAGDIQIELEARSENAYKALEYVYRVQTSQCTGGTEEKFDLQFNHSAWIRLTEIALRTANLFTKILVSHNNSLNSLTDQMFYTVVRNNVHGERMLYGSAVAIAPGIYKYDQFCPYAHRKNGSISVHDVAVNYDYHINTTEWWYGPKNQNFDNISVIEDTILYRSGDVLLPAVEEETPVAKLSDGYWTKPYYDCGGGDVWMVTYLAPIFGLDFEIKKPFFLGIASVDIELTLLDINQCDPDGKVEGALDVFRGTHHCLSSTKCLPLSGLGFKRGAYKCVCADGFYFPDIRAEDKFFLGLEIEVRWKEKDFPQFFSCTPCAPGCLTCDDNTPCLYTRNIALRIIILLLTVTTIIGIIFVSLVVYIYRSQMAIRTASPVFLQLMCLGCLLMCSYVFVIFPEPTAIICAAKGWPMHIGFVLMYGALVLKTWRISVIFRVGSIKKIQLPDYVLVQRLVPCIGVTVGFLAAWTAADPPRAETFRTEAGLKYQGCSQSWWYYAALGGELTLLLYGCYLCFTVRKAPAHFNESKKIAWTIYNAIILGSFNVVITIFIGYSAGPDVLYLLSFLEVQVYVTITICFIFGPKFWALYKKAEVSDFQATFSVTGRMKKPATAVSIIERFSTNIKTSGTQTSPEFFNAMYVKHKSSRPKPSIGSARVAPTP
ncbi:hypothetical protein ScPMuIL_014379 [Solemya velum]